MQEEECKGGDKMELERLEKELESLKTARENMKSGNVTPADVNVIIETLRQAELDKARKLYEIRKGLEDDFEYRETHRNKR